MLPLIVLFTSFVILVGLGRLGQGRLRSRIVALRFAFAIMFLFTAAAHFGA